MVRDSRGRPLRLSLTDCCKQCAQLSHHQLSAPALTATFWHMIAIQYVNNVQRWLYILLAQSCVSSIGLCSEVKCSQSRQARRQLQRSLGALTPGSSKVLFSSQDSETFNTTSPSWTTNITSSPLRVCSSLDRHFFWIVSRSFPQDIPLTAASPAYLDFTSRRTTVAFTRASRRRRRITACALRSSAAT